MNFVTILGTAIFSNTISLFKLGEDRELFANQTEILKLNINKEMHDNKIQKHTEHLFTPIDEVFKTFIHIYCRNNPFLAQICIGIYTIIKYCVQKLGYNLAKLEYNKLINFEYNFGIYISILLPIILIILIILIIIFISCKVPRLVRTSKKVFDQRLNKVDRLKYNLLAQKLLTYTSIKKKIRFLLVIVDYISQHQTQAPHTYEYWNDIIKNIFSLPIRRNSINKFLLKLSKDIPNECIEHIQNRIRYNEILSPFMQIRGPGIGDTEIYERRQDTEDFNNNYLKLLKIIK